MLVRDQCRIGSKECTVAEIDVGRKSVSLNRSSQRDGEVARQAWRLTVSCRGVGESLPVIAVYGRFWSKDVAENSLAWLPSDAPRLH